MSRAGLSAIWRDAWTDRTLRAQIVVTPLCLVATLGALAPFLVWVEGRPGIRLSDPLLGVMAPRNATWFIFGLIYLSLIVGLTVLAFEPRALVIGVQAFIVMALSRVCAMYLTALDPPADMIPLRDPVVEIVGTGRLLTRDLFFSGHTSTLFLLFLAVPHRRFRALLLACTMGVAVGVLLQHVHYTIDVLTAPVFAFASHRAVLAVHERLSRRAGV
jgi:hypothetical protein